MSDKEEKFDLPDPSVKYDIGMDKEEKTNWWIEWDSTLGVGLARIIGGSSSGDLLIKENPMTDKRYCGNCVEMMYVTQDPHNRDWICRENRLNGKQIESPSIITKACSHHKHYDEVFGDRDELREKIDHIRDATKKVGEGDE